MSFLGMGTLEILIVVLVAFLFLGPERMAGAARTLGRMVGEARRMTADLPELILDESDSAQPTEAPIVHRGGGPNPSVKRYTDDSRTSSPASNEAAENDSDGEDSPVPFQRPSAAPGKPEPPSTRESI